jgi:hypothetical protein
VIGDGSTVLFWKYFLINGTLLGDNFPRLYSFAINEELCILTLCFLYQWKHSMSFKWSLLYYYRTPITSDTLDQRTFVWGSSGYAPAKFYKFMFALLPSDSTIYTIWKSRMMPKLKVFTWLLFHGRLNTLDLMTRKQWHLEARTDCVSCIAHLNESRDHLFFECAFAKECWAAIGIQWNMNLPISTRIMIAKQSFSGPCFIEIIACAAWNIWKMRN